MMRTRGLIGSALALLVAATSPALGQEPRPERPYRGLFGGGIDLDAEQSLVASASLGGGYSTGLMLGVRLLEGDADPRLTDSQAFNQFSGGINYSLSRGRASVRAGGSAAGRYFGELSDPWIAGYGGTIAGAFQLTTRTGFSFDQGVAYQPLHSFDVFPSVFEPTPGLIQPFDQSLATVREPRVSYNTNVGLSHQLSQRTQISAGYGRVMSDAENAGVDLGTSTIESFGAQFSHGLSRSLSLRLGYGLGTGRYPGELEETRFRSQNFDGGIDFNKALSISRRTRVAFSTGTSALSDGTTTRFHVSGNANLTREIGRTFSAGLAYNRSAQFIETLRQPVFQDSLSATFGGLISRRLQVSASTGIAFGTVGLGTADDEADGYNSTFASTGLSIGLTRRLGVNIGYTYYRYRFDNVSALPPGSVRQTNRHAVQAGLQVSAPIFERQRARSANASR